MEMSRPAVIDASKGDAEDLDQVSNSSSPLNLLDTISNSPLDLLSIILVD
jgi:hypothetical protein